ncbi:MAG: hypothetical protein KatS3mg027_0437 [Bacteroidia bacterium]|nr:MAG: hypothetical protein KatS3mg027_0437 [Bacteroidia bacterium]
MEYEIFKSTDDGETWTSEFILTGIRLDAIINVSSELIAISQDRLGRVLFNKDGSLETIELKNDGLETKKIRGVCLWNGKVWVATNAGLFYKSYDDFINNK